MILAHFVLRYKIMVIIKGRYLARRYRSKNLEIGFLTLDLIVVHHTSLDNAPQY